MNTSLIHALAQYNAQANRVLMDTAAGLTAEQLDNAPNLSHASAFKLIRHLLTVEAHYLGECRGRALEIDHLSFTTLEGLRRACTLVGDELLVFTATLSDDEAAQVLDVNIGEHAFRFSIWQLLLQVFMHSAHHRGELAVLLTSLGRPLPIEDIIVQFAEESGQSWPWK